MIRLLPPLLFLAATGFAQSPPDPVSVNRAQPDAPSIPAVTTPNDAAASSTYILGAGDQLTLTVADVEDFNDKTFRIDMRGDLNLPLTGRLHAAGLTVSQLEAETADRLSRIIKDPDVVISVATFGSQPVSILGAVTTPGIRQLEGQKTLYEVLSLAGGLRMDAGNTVHITRDLKFGPIPLADAKDDETDRFSIASVKVRKIMNGGDPAENITVKPGDVISIPKADMVYAVGSVTKPGGFLLTENETISTLQVISLAEGLQKTAAPNKAKILRAVPGSEQRTEIAVNIKQLMAGKATDIPLQSNDILFIPNSGAKTASYRTLDAIVNMATGMAVYGRY